ncbi:unnamed protein product [Lampetra planeri]
MNPSHGPRPPTRGSVLPPRAASELRGAASLPMVHVEAAHFTPGGRGQTQAGTLRRGPPPLLPHCTRPHTARHAELHPETRTGREAPLRKSRSDCRNGAGTASASLPKGVFQQLAFDDR